MKLRMSSIPLMLEYVAGLASRPAKSALKCFPGGMLYNIFSIDLQQPFVCFI